MEAQLSSVAPVRVTFCRILRGRHFFVLVNLILSPPASPAPFLYFFLQIRLLVPRFLPLSPPSRPPRLVFTCSPSHSLGPLFTPPRLRSSRASPHRRYSPPGASSWSCTQWRCPKATRGRQSSGWGSGPASSRPHELCFETH